MLFDTTAWKLIDKRYPLTSPEIGELRQAVSDSGLLLHALIQWGQAIKDNYTSAWWDAYTAKEEKVSQ